MALESGTYISDLVPANPTSGDSAAQGDDHIRLIKAVLQNTFPNINGAVTATDNRLNSIVTSDGISVKGRKVTGSGNTIDLTMAELKDMLGLAASAFEPLSTFALAGHDHDADYAPFAHTHSAASINSGVMDAARLPTAGIGQKGIVEKATTAEMTAGTANKYPDAEKVKEYFDTVALAPKATVDIDLDSGLRKQSAVHSFGKRPRLYKTYLQCKTTDGDYNNGERVELPGYHSASGVNLGCIVSSDNTLVTIRKATMRLLTDDGTLFAIDESKWKLVFHIYE